MLSDKMSAALKADDSWAKLQAEIILATAAVRAFKVAVQELDAKLKAPMIADPPRVQVSAPSAASEEIWNTLDAWRAAPANATGEGA